MIWLIGGTSESLEIAKELSGFSLLISTATPEGGVMFSSFEHIVKIGKLTLPEMKRLIAEYEIRYIIDASHPFAEEVSINAMAVATDKKIPYLRYERPRLKLPSYVKKFQTYEGICTYLKKVQKNILLTIGVKNLNRFKELDKNRLYCRILPLAKSLIGAEKAGFLFKNILALKGPFSMDFNRALIREYKIGCVVTKASGTAGGEESKIIAARMEGAEILCLERSLIHYPLVLNRISEIKVHLQY